MQYAKNIKCNMATLLISRQRSGAKDRECNQTADRELEGRHFGIIFAMVAGFACRMLSPGKIPSYLIFIPKEFVNHRAASTQSNDFYQYLSRA
jgi:hypothetical protein